MTNNFNRKAAAKHVLELKQVQFYGGISVAPDGGFYMSTNPDEPRYVGHPTPEMDKAWEDLIARKYKHPAIHCRHSLTLSLVRYVGLSHDEAMSIDNEEAWGRRYNDTYWAAYVFPFYQMKCSWQSCKLIHK